jgi:hypothetical protein
MFTRLSKRTSGRRSFRHVRIRSRRCCSPYHSTIKCASSLNHLRAGGLARASFAGVLDDCSGVSGRSETDFADPKTFQASLVISKERPPHWLSGIAHLKFATNQPTRPAGKVRFGAIWRLMRSRWQEASCIRESLLRPLNNGRYDSWPGETCSVGPRSNGQSALNLASASSPRSEQPET